jgi:hypothetical protein
LELGEMACKGLAEPNKLSSKLALGKIETQPDLQHRMSGPKAPRLVAPGIFKIEG